MKSTSLILYSTLLVAPFYSSAGERLIPAGSLIQCTVSEPKVSSKTESVGDPILCQIGHAGYRHQFGTSTLPYDSYMVGQFEGYKDPGHFVGKGWMLLTFDRMVIEPDTEVPISAKVVNVSGYNIDREGRIRGKGHAVRDTVEWTIPVLWPIDMINLPRRGPRPSLKTETRLVLKVMDDIVVPMGPTLQEPSPGLLRRTPSAYTPQRTDPNLPLGANLDRIAVSETPREIVKPARMSYSVLDGQNGVTLVFKDGRPPEGVSNFVLTPTHLYVINSGYRRIIPLIDLDLAATREVNREAGVDFRVPGRSGE